MFPHLRPSCSFKNEQAPAVPQRKVARLRVDEVTDKFLRRAISKRRVRALSVVIETPDLDNLASFGELGLGWITPTQTPFALFGRHTRTLALTWSSS